ncbi:MAG TPA: hypothetical protein VFZ56_03025 [Gemmatimonadaceae bacterium]
MNARFLTSAVALVLLTACGSEYEPYTTQPLPPEGPGGTTTHTVLIEASSAGTGAGTVTGTGLSCSIAGPSQSSDCTETFANGTQITLTATPAAGSLFLGWGDACSASGTTSTCTVMVDRQLRVQAGFAPVPSHNVIVSAGAASTGNGTVTAAGINCLIAGTASSQDCSEPHVQGTSVTFTAAPTGGSTFLGWGDACAAAGSSTTCTVTVSQEVRVSASFAAPPSHAVTVSAGAGSQGNGTVTAAGINCLVTGPSVSQDCDESYVQGTAVTLTAAPSGAGSFVQWGGACASAGSNPTCSITVTQALTVSATFAPPPSHLVTVSAGAASTGNGTVSATGINCVIAATSATQDCSETYVQGSTVTLTATPTGNSEFSQWGGACSSAGTSPTCTLTVTQASAVSASFEAGIAPPPPTHVLTVQAGVSGTASGTVTASGISCSITGSTQSGDCSESLNEGTSVTLTATPAGDNTFLGWGGACSGTSSTCTVLMSQARTVTASFAPPPSHVLTVQAGASGTASGSVTASGISCSISGATQSGDCSESFTEGTTVTLTAAPTANNVFLGWGGACTGTSSTCMVTMSQARTVTASFAPPPTHLLTVQAGAGTANGSVTATGISCSITGATQSGDCSESFVEGTSVTLTATPAGVNMFLGWGGSCTGASSTCTVTMSQARTVTASFGPPPSYTLTVAAASTSAGTGTVTATGINCTLSGSSQADDCSESFVTGTSVTLTATATGGSAFEGWGGACSAAGSTPTCTVSMTQARTVTASFTAPPPPNLAGFWSGTDDGGHIHYHMTMVQSGNTLSLQPSCTPGDCRLIALTGSGNTWLGGAPFADITALSGTITGNSVTITMTAGSAGTVTYTGTWTAPNQIRGEVSSATMPKQNLTMVGP